MAEIQRRERKQMLEERSEIAGVETRFAWEKREVQIDVEEFKMNGSRGSSCRYSHAESGVERQWKNAVWKGERVVMKIRRPGG